MSEVSVVYFVTWFLHNKDNGGWAYKVENKYTTKDAAEKAFHTLLGNDLGGNPYDVVMVLLTDSLGNVWKNERYPEPVPEIEE
jgi:hypothetical protein